MKKLVIHSRVFINTVVYMLKILVSEGISYLFKRMHSKAISNNLFSSNLDFNYLFLMVFYNPTFPGHHIWNHFYLHVKVILLVIKPTNK